MARHWAMECMRPQQFSHHRVFDSDAPQSVKVEFERACDALSFDMDRAMCREDYRTILQARGGAGDVERIRLLRARFGLTKNATVLTALRVGLGVLEATTSGGES